MCNLLKLVANGLLIAILLSFAGFAFADEDVGLEDVLVEASFNDGSANKGYKVDIFNSLGPLGDRQILNTPYSMFAISSDLIENTVVGNLEQVFKMNPLVTRGIANSNINQISSPALRGFTINSTFIDGIRADNQGMGMFLEDKEKVEIFSGLSGFLFGSGNVGGVVNYVTKRPTPYYLNKITAGYRGGTSFFGHADIGGPINEGKFGYRFNAMYQDGDTDIKNQSLRRQLVSAAIDWNASDDLQFQLNGTYNLYELNGRQGMFNLSNTTAAYWHNPLDSTKLYAPQNTYHDVESYNLGARVKYRLNDSFSLRAAYSRKYDTRQMFYATGQRFINDTNQYGLNLMVFDRRWTSDGAYAYIDAKFDTFDINHTITFGGDLNYNLYEPIRYVMANGTYNASPSTPNVGGLPAFIFPWGQEPFGTPGPEGVYAYKAGRFKQTRSFNKNLMIGDEIKFNEQWILLAGINLTYIETKNYDVITKAQSSKYDKNALTPTISLMYKPLSNITLYGTYMEALEQGSIVGMNYTNSGEIMSPVRSTQYEIGVKTELQGLLLTLALFQIERASTMDRVNANGTVTLTQDGNQVNRGLEFTFSGKFVENLTLVGGATYIDAEIKKSNTAANNGNVPQGLPAFTAKLYTEYDMAFIEGLTVTGGIYYVGSSWRDNANTAKLKAYTTADLGLRYTTDKLGPETTFRLAVNNIANKRYWISSDPANAQIGAGRTVYFSTTVSF